MTIQHATFSAMKKKSYCPYQSIQSQALRQSLQWQISRAASVAGWAGLILLGAIASMTTADAFDGVDPQAMKPNLTHANSEQYRRFAFTGDFRFSPPALQVQLPAPEASLNAVATKPITTPLRVVRVYNTLGTTTHTQQAALAIRPVRTETPSSKQLAQPEPKKLQSPANVKSKTDIRGYQPIPDKHIATAWRRFDTVSGIKTSGLGSPATQPEPPSTQLSPALEPKPSPSRTPKANTEASPSASSPISEEGRPQATPEQQKSAKQQSAGLSKDNVKKSGRQRWRRYSTRAQKRAAARKKYLRRQIEKSNREEEWHNNVWYGNGAS